MTAGHPRGPVAGVALLALAAGALAGCHRHLEVPAVAPRGALAGFAPPGFDAARACGSWVEAAAGSAEAASHVSFPEGSPAACYVPVRYEGELASPGPTPAGCGYPRANETGSAQLLQVVVGRRLAASRDRYLAIAAGSTDEPLPPELACSLPAADRAAAARQNAAVLATLVADLQAGESFPYSAIGTFGFGHRDHGRSVLAGWRPGDTCRPMSQEELDLLNINVTRAGRGALAHAGRVAPVVVTSGGAVHSPLIEAFALAHLATCRFHVPADRVLVDPCADHTHTNVKHTGSLVLAIGGKTAYLVTDDGLQADYLEEWTLFDLIGGSIDQRALRDWGYLLGSWRRASVGMRAGFWFSPHRFWAEPASGLGSFACSR